MKNNIFGKYTVQGPISCSKFFQENTPEMAKLFGIQPHEMEVICANLGYKNSIVLVGTQKNPLTRGGNPEITDYKLRVVFNLSIINEMAEGRTEDTFDYDIAAGFLWSAIANAFRLFQILEGNIGDEDLIRADIFARYKMQNLYEANLQNFDRMGWSGKEMNKQIDILFISGFISRLIVFWGTSNEEFNFEEVARIIRDTKRFNIDLPLCFH